MERAAHPAEFDSEGLKEPRLEVGLVGLGRAGFAHWARSEFQDKWRIAAVCQSNERALQEFARARSVPRAYTDYHKMFRRHALRGAIIATPPRVAALVATDAIECGVRAVLIEKPGAVHADELEMLSRVAAHHGARVAIAYPRRHRSHVLAARQWLHSRVPREWRITIDWSDRYREWFDGGSQSKSGFRSSAPVGSGALLESGCHAIDLLGWLFGPISTVLSAHTQPGTRGVDVGAQLAVRFAAGHVATVALTSLLAPPVHRLHAVSDDCELTLDDARVCLCVREANEIFEFDHSDEGLWADFLALMNGEPAERATTLEEAIGTLRVIDQAYALAEAVAP